MDKLKDSFFQSYFEMSTPRLVVRSNAPDYTVVATNTAFKQEGFTLTNEATGCSLDILFSNFFFNEYGVHAFKAALIEAANQSDNAPVPELVISSDEKSSDLTSWWQIELLPIWEKNELPDYIVISMRDITSHVFSQQELQQSRHREQTLNEELAATNEELLALNEELHDLNEQLETRVQQRNAELFVAQAKVLENHALLEAILNDVPAGICVFKGPEMILETINKKLMEMWKRHDNIVGKPLLEVLPEISLQAFPKILAEVYSSGIPYMATDAKATLFLEGVSQTVYRDYSYTPLKDADGKTHSIVALSVDVTERSLARLREQELIEEQSAINEELAAANEEMTATNEELHYAQQSQKQLITTLESSESRFRNLIMQAPVAICMLRGKDHVVEAANEEALKILGTAEQITGLCVKEILPDVLARPFRKLLNQVYLSGDSYYGQEVKIGLNHLRKADSGYVNFILKPLKDGKSVSGIMIVATEVTSLITARTAQENAETKFAMAIEAAKMGSWHIDPKTKALDYNSALAEIFGYKGVNPMTYDQAINQVTDDYRDSLVREIDYAINTGGHYDITYTQRRFNDNQIIWLRSLGKIMTDESGEVSNFSGVVLDVTEQKQDEQRKNDFIGMVSHELKTPLTSLNGYTQLLHSRAIKAQDTFSASALTKVIQQIKKMTAMINGFLNISRLESGKIHLNAHHFKLDELIREHIEEAKMIANSHILIFHPCEPITVFADQEKIGAVLSNMISNAIKYSPNGKDVKIKCESTAHYVQVSISDQGLGISLQDIPKLFERFYRVETDQTQQISGFGIGLYLSAEIIKSHQGQIWAESILGQGSEFFFRLPLSS